MVQKERCASSKRHHSDGWLRIGQMKLGNSMQLNTIVSQKVYVVTIIGNYMFRPVPAIFRLS